MVMVISDLIFRLLRICESITIVNNAHIIALIIYFFISPVVAAFVHHKISLIYLIIHVYKYIIIAFSKL